MLHGLTLPLAHCSYSIAPPIPSLDKGRGDANNLSFSSQSVVGLYKTAWLSSHHSTCYCCKCGMVIGQTIQLIAKLQSLKTDTQPTYSSKPFRHKSDKTLFTVARWSWVTSQLQAMISDLINNKRLLYCVTVLYQQLTSGQSW